MASSISSRGFFRNPEIIQQEIQTLLDSPVRSEDRKDVVSKIAALLKEFRAAPRLDSEKFNALKGRFADWMRQPAPALQTAEGTSCVALPLLTKVDPAGDSVGRSSSAAVTVDTIEGSLPDQTLLLDNDEFLRLQLLLNDRIRTDNGCGIEDYFSSYITFHMLRFSYDWQSSDSSVFDRYCLEQLNDFLLALSISDPAEKVDKLTEFFGKQLEQMLAHKVPTNHNSALAFVYGFQMCLRKDVGRLHSSAGPSTSRLSSVAKKTSVVDGTAQARYVNEVIELGSKAVEYLGKLTGQYLVYYGPFIRRTIFEMGYDIKQMPPDSTIGKRDAFEIIGSVLGSKDLSKELRTSLSIEFRVLHNSFIESERALHSLQIQFSAFIDRSLPAFQKIKEQMIQLLDLKRDIEGERSLLLSIIKENCDEILNDRHQILDYLEEFIRHIEKAEKAARMMFSFDGCITYSKTDLNLLLKQDFRKWISESTNYALITDQDVLEELGLRRKKREILINLYNELKRSNEAIENIYLGDFLRLHECIKKGMILIEDTTGSIDEAKAALSPGCSHPTAEGNSSSTTTPKLPLVSADLQSSSVLSAKAVPSPKIRFTGADFSSNIRKIVPEQSFKNEESRNAYRNALHYVESLYALLTEAPRVWPQPNLVAQRQMDIGFASFHAIEQLLSALMLEKVQINEPLAGVGKAFPLEEGYGSIFKKVGHSLIQRLLLAKIRPEESVRSLLRDLEGMEFVIRDLPSRGSTPSLLANTAELLSASKVCTSVLAEEARSCCLYGQRVLHSFEFLLSQAPVTRSDIKLDPYLAFVESQLAEVPPSSAVKGNVTDSTEVFIEGDRVNALQELIEQSLGKSLEDRPLIRKLTLKHNITRYLYLRNCLANHAKLSLFPFYINQARFVLRTIMEEFLCAAHEKKVGSVCQKELDHRIGELAVLLKLSGLAPEERGFLATAASERNKARYGDKVKGHFLPEGAIAIEGAPLEEGISLVEGFTMALGSRYQTMLRGLEQEFSIVEKLCTKVAQQCFGVKGSTK